MFAAQPVRPWHGAGAQELRLVIIPRSFYLPVAVTEGSRTENPNKTGAALDRLLPSPGASEQQHLVGRGGQSGAGTTSSIRSSMATGHAEARDTSPTMFNGPGTASTRRRERSPRAE